MAGFKCWRSAVRDEVAAASGKGDGVFRWILKAEDKDVTMEQLTDSGRNWVGIEMKLKAAISKLATGELARRISRASEDARKEERVLKRTTGPSAGVHLLQN